MANSFMKPDLVNPPWYPATPLNTRSSERHTRSHALHTKLAAVKLAGPIPRDKISATRSSSERTASMATLDFRPQHMLLPSPQAYMRYANSEWGYHSIYMGEGRDARSWRRRRSHLRVDRLAEDPPLPTVVQPLVIHDLLLRAVVRFRPIHELTVHFEERLLLEFDLVA